MGEINLGCGFIGTLKYDADHHLVGTSFFHAGYHREQQGGIIPDGSDDQFTFYSVNCRVVEGHEPIAFAERFDGVY